MLIVVAVAMLRAAMLMLAAVLMLIAMSHLQDPDKQWKPDYKGPITPPTPEDESNSNNESKEDNEVSIPVCGSMHLDA